MTLYCGIDLHANNSVISIIDDHDAVLYENRHSNESEHRARLHAATMASSQMVALARRQVRVGVNFLPVLPMNADQPQRNANQGHADR